MNTPSPTPNGQAILALLQADLAAAEAAVAAAGEAATVEQTAAVTNINGMIVDVQSYMAQAEELAGAQQSLASVNENAAVYEQQLQDAQASVNKLTVDKTALTQQVADLTGQLAEVTPGSEDAELVAKLQGEVKTLTDAGAAKDAQIAALQQASDDAASGVSQDLGPVPDGCYDNNVTRRREVYKGGKIVMAVAEDIVGANAFNLPSEARGVWTAFPDVPRNSVKAAPTKPPA